MEGSSAERPARVEFEQPYRFETSGYERLLERLLDEGRRFVGFDERAEGVVLHHDVALSLDRALTMGRLETTLRIDGTYCLPLDAPVHDVSTVTLDRTARTLSRLGHDVGLRFDPHAHWNDRPSESALRAKIDEEREVLSRLLGESVDVVSFRQPPDWVRDLELDDAVNACHGSSDVPARERFVDREWRGEDPFAGGVPESFRLVVHPGLWQPVERTASEVLASLRRSAHEQVDAYFEAFDVP